MQNKVSAIIPTFNEKSNIVLLIEQIQKTVVLYNIPFEIIIVDDNSPDRTALEIKNRFSKEKTIRLFVRKKEKGLASAILFGIKKATGNIVVNMDGDFNHPPKLIPQLLSGLKEADMATGSRFVKGGGMEDNIRYFFTLAFNLFLKYVLSFPIMDNTSGFYAIKKEKLLELPLDKIYRGYGEYHLRLVFMAKKLKMKIKEIPVYYKKRVYGESKSNLIKMFVIYIKEALLLRFFYNGL